MKKKYKIGNYTVDVKGNKISLFKQGDLIVVLERLSDQEFTEEQVGHFIVDYRLLDVKNKKLYVFA